MSNYKATIKWQRNGEDMLAITHVQLHPETRFCGDSQPDADRLAHLHHLAHECCFIANSVNTQIDIILGSL